MDINVCLRLDSRRGNENYDAQFANRVSSTARAYIESGVRILNFYQSDFDAATDIVEMLQPVSNATEFKAIDRNDALALRHPASFTQMHVLVTFLAEILDGSQQARSVEAQGEDDEAKADDINSLLAWNDGKIPLYTQMWMYIWNAVVYNRGIWFEDSDQDVVVSREPVDEPDLSKPKVPLMRKDGRGPVLRGGKPVMVNQTRQRMRNVRTRSGFFNTLHLVSPYDFICDASLPIVDFQKGRFAGHRVMIPWHQLKTWSEMEPEDPNYVLPHIVWKVKNARENAITTASLGGTPGINTTRTYYERTARNGGIAGGAIGGNGVGSATGSDGVNKDDGGTIECFQLFIRAKPKTMRMYDDDDFEVINMLVTSGGDVLRVNVQPNKHDEFPYAPVETIPNGFRQFTPGWGLKCKPIQDRMDELNCVHAKAQARMGNIFVVDDTKVDVSSLTARDKNGIMAQRRLEGRGAPVADLISQIPVEDTTAKYNEEMGMWNDIMENMTGANAYTQGVTDDPSQTLGQFDATQKMATGRISSLARIISEIGIMPQTRRWVMNLQQFLSEEQEVRIMGKQRDYDPETPQPKYKKINKIDIQGNFDVVPHDGSLPGADAKVVAAAARTIEAYANNPALARVFDITVPGSIDPVKVARDLFKKSGLPVSSYAVSKEEAIKNAAGAMGAAGQFDGQPQPAQAPFPNGLNTGATAPAAPMVSTGVGNIPSAAVLPANQAATPPQLTGVTS